MTIVQSFLQVMWYVTIATPVLLLLVASVGGLLHLLDACDRYAGYKNNRFHILCSAIVSVVSCVMLATLLLWVGSGSVDISTYSSFKNSIRTIPTPVQAEDNR